MRSQTAHFDVLNSYAYEFNVWKTVFRKLTTLYRNVSQCVTKRTAVRSDFVPEKTWR